MLSRFSKHVNWLLSVIIVLIGSVQAQSTLVDDFEAGNLEQWTIAGRQEGVNTAEVIFRDGSNQAHIRHEDYTEITLENLFTYSESHAFEFDMEVAVSSDASDTSTFWAAAGVFFKFMGADSNSLGWVSYEAYTSQLHPDGHNTDSTHVNEIVAGSMDYYFFTMTNLLSQITLAEDPSMVKLEYRAYTTGWPYNMTGDVWIDNVIVSSDNSDQLLIATEYTLPYEIRGLFWGDPDNDGDMDLFLPLVRTDGTMGPDNALLMNDGAGNLNLLNDVSNPITNDAGYSMGGSWGDFNNDGTLDLFVANNRPHNVGWTEANFLYSNTGNGAYAKITTGDIVTETGGSQESTWADYDGDGDLDLYVTNSDWQVNYLYQNQGDGTFTKILSGHIVTNSQSSRAASWADYDGDGDPDLFVANMDNQVNNLYENMGDGTFQLVSTGSIVTETAHSRGCSWGDYNNDGDLDLFVPNYGGMNFLYQNNGDGTFTKIVDNSNPVVTDSENSRGSSWGDYDNDGDLDLYITNNGVGEQNVLYTNEGNGSFNRLQNIAATDSTNLSIAAAWVDIDNDGDLDLSTTKISSSNTYHIQINTNSGNNNHWTVLSLRGDEHDITAIGAKIWIKTNSGWQFREITSLSGNSTQNDNRVHFGLGTASIIDSIQIRWPSGIVWDTTNVAVNQFLTISEPSISENLVAHYPFNGNANDESGNGNDGVEYGGVTLTSDRFGNTNSAYSFDGADDVIELPPAVSGNQSFSLVMWTFLEDTSAYAPIVLHTEDGGVQYVNYDDRISAWDWPSRAGGTDYTNLIHYNTNTFKGHWTQVVVTCQNSETPALYVNGQFVSNISNIDYPSGTYYHNTIGAIYDSGASVYQNLFIGILDDFSIYSRTLSILEIDSLYHLGGWPNINQFVTLDFEDQSLSDWTIVEAVPNSGQMDIITGSLDGTGDYVLQTVVNNAGGNENDRAAAYYLPSTAWSNYDLSYDFKIISTNYYNYTDQYFYIEDETGFMKNGYRLRFFQGNNEAFLSLLVDSVGTTLASTSINLGPNTAYHVDIQTDSEGIDVLLDGVSILTSTDNTYRNGGFAFGTSTAGLENGITAQYDNIVCNYEAGTQQEIMLSIPNINGSHTDTVLVPLNVDFSGASNYSSSELNIGGYQSGLDFVDVVTTSSLIGDAGWTLSVNETDSNLVIWAAGANDISGSGTLLYLQFVVISEDCGYFPINIESAVFNNGIDLVTITNGGINYGGEPDVYGDADENGVIQALDASTILKHLVGLDSLNCQGLANAEVSCNDTITAYDASLILQKGVGLIDSLPWCEPVLALGNITYDDEIPSEANMPFDIPIYLNDGSNIYSYECKIDFFPEDVQFNSITWVGPFGDSTREYYDNEQGIIHLIGANYNALEVNGEIAVLHFVTTASFEDSTSISGSLLLNENLSQSISINVVMGIEDDLSLPTTYALHQNYPNPFNPTTTLHYDLPNDSDVRIVVYDVMGREVAELVNGELVSGKHQVVWNGKNTTGIDMPTGMYFAKMTTSEYSQVVKMLFIK